MTESFDFRVGLGQDSHRFSQDPEKKLILGGIEIIGEQGLEANSDGDAVSHALCNALEQAIGGGSLSLYANEMRRNGISDSREYLKVAVKHIEEKGYKINNIGVSIEARRPKLENTFDKMREALRKILKVGKNQIGINATTGENLTPFGKGDGIQVFATVSLIKK